MKRSRFIGLAAVVMLTMGGSAAQAQPVASLAKAGIGHMEGTTAAVVQVGWRAKRHNALRSRGMRRVHRGQRRYGFRDQRRAAAMTPYVQPGVASMLIKRRKCLDALFPATDPACR